MAKIDLDAPGTLSGIAPTSDQYMRGGTIAQGSIRRMVEEGLKRIDEGFIDVLIFTDNQGTIDGKMMREIASRKDFKEK